MRRRLLSLLLLLCASIACGQQIPDVVARVGQSNYTHYLRNLLFTHDGDTRYPGSPQLLAARDSIRNTFASFGLTTSLQPFQWRDGTFYNVVAVLEGKTRPSEFHVLGAHYDSANTPGADDDATGVAGLLEAARVLSMFDFEMSIVFIAFDREEAGLVGSKAWVAEHSGDRILSMLQLDMIGFNTSPTFNLLALVLPGASPNPVYAKFDSAVRQYSGGLIPVYGGISTRSDHASFGSLTSSLSAIEASFAMNLNYHKVTDSVDTPGYIDYSFATGVTRSVVGYLASEAALVPAQNTAAAARFSSAGIANAASWVFGHAAPSQIVSLIGSGLTSESGASGIGVGDVNGSTRAAEILYASPGQINFVMPSDVAPGPATLTVVRGDGLTASVELPLEPVAPGLFAANAAGFGVAAGQAVRVSRDGAQTEQSLFECDSASFCRSLPVDFGGEDDRVVAVLYATGIRNRTAREAVIADVAGWKLPVEYAGPQPSYAGLDQVNFEVPRTLRGRGEVSVTLVVDGKPSTPVTINLGSL